jgi:ABC-type sugar transport system ATPase subunit
VNLVEELGSEAFVYAQPIDQAVSVTGEQVSLGSVTEIITRVEPHKVPEKGASIHIRAKDNSILFFDSETGLRIYTDR